MNVLGLLLGVQKTCEEAVKSFRSNILSNCTPFQSLREHKDFINIKMETNFSFDDILEPLEVGVVSVEGDNDVFVNFVLS